MPSVFNFKEKALEEGEKKIRRYERNIKRVKHDSLNRNLGTSNSKLVIKKKKKISIFSLAHHQAGKNFHRFYEL